MHLAEFVYSGRELWEANRKHEFKRQAALGNILDTINSSSAQTSAKGVGSSGEEKKKKPKKESQKRASAPEDDDDEGVEEEVARKRRRKEQLLQIPKSSSTSGAVDQVLSLMRAYSNSGSSSSTFLSKPNPATVPTANRVENTDVDQDELDALFAIDQEGSSKSEKEKKKKKDRKAPSSEDATDSGQTSDSPKPNTGKKKGKKPKSNKKTTPTARVEEP